MTNKSIKNQIVGDIKKIAAIKKITTISSDDVQDPAVHNEILGECATQSSALDKLVKSISTPVETEDPIKSI